MWINKKELSKIKVEIEELKQMIRKVCQHEEGYYFFINSLHGCSFYIKKCRVCGDAERMGSSQFRIEQEAQEIKECEDKLKKLKGDKKCTK